MKKKTILIVFGIFALVIFAIYAYLGGFNPLMVALLPQKKYVAVGQYYEGLYDSDSVRAIFFDAKEILLKEYPQSVLSIVNYQAGTETDTAKAFIGVVLSDNDTEVAALKNFEKRTIEASGVVRIHIKAHSAVMPTRTTIEKKAQAFAKENNISLSPVEIEQYISDQELIIDRIIK